MALIRSLFWFAIFVASTFAFTVVFEHGVGNFSGNAEVEFKLWQSTVQKWINGESTVERKKDTSDKIGQ
jgi:hypothetical protein